MGKIKAESFFLPSSKTKHGYFKIDLNAEKVIARIYYSEKRNSRDNRILSNQEDSEKSEMSSFDLDEFCRVVSTLLRVKKASISALNGTTRLDLSLEEKKNGEQIRLEFHLKKQKITFWISKKKFFSFIPSPRFIIIFQISSAIENICELNQLTYTWFEMVWTRNYYRAFRKAEDLKKEWEEEVQNYLHYVILPLKMVRLPSLMKLKEQ